MNQRLKILNQDIILNCLSTDVDGAENNFLKQNDKFKSNKKYFIKIHCLFIQISTDYIFDGKNGPYSEFDTPNPINKYGQSKLNGEKIALEMANKLILIRANVIFDLNSKASFLIG